MHWICKNGKLPSKSLWTWGIFVPLIFDVWRNQRNRRAIFGEIFCFRLINLMLPICLEQPLLLSGLGRFLFSWNNLKSGKKMWRESGDIRWRQQMNPFSLETGGKSVTKFPWSRTVGLLCNYTGQEWRLQRNWSQRGCILDVYWAKPKVQPCIVKGIAFSYRCTVKGKCV